MDGNPAASTTPATVRRLDSEGAAGLAELVAVFEELQMVLRCCERLIEELAADGPDALVVEAVWTTALLSYARCFSESEGSSRLTEADLHEAQPTGDTAGWHRVLLQLRDHHAHPVENPRERFAVGVTQDTSGAASGVAISSASQPMVDDPTVRQTGALAYSLSVLVDGRIGAAQQALLKELRGVAGEVLDRLELVELGPTSRDA